MDGRYETCREILEGALGRLDGLDKVKLEFEKVWNAVEKSNESNVRLKTKISELESEIILQGERFVKAKSDEETLQTQKKLIQEQLEKNQLKKEEHRRLLHDKKERLEEVRQNIKDINSQLEAGSGWTPEQERKMSQLRKRQADLEHLLEQKMTNLQVARQDIDILTETVNKAEDAKLALEGEISELALKVEENELECKQAQMQRDRVDADLRTLKGDVEKYQLELVDKEMNIKEGKEEIENLEVKLKNAKKKMEFYLKEYDTLFQQTHRLTEELEDQVRINQHLDGELAKREKEIELKTKESKLIKKDIDRIKKLMEHTEKKIAETEKDRDKAETKRTQIREKTRMLETEIQLSRKENEKFQRQIDDLVKERDILNKTLVKAEERTKQVHDLIAVHHNTKRNLENEIQGYKADAIRDRQAIEAMEEDVQKYEIEVANENQKYLNALEEVRLQDARIAELQRKIMEGDTKLKQQQNLYEAVRSDRNLYSKNLIDAQNEITEMKRKFKIMNHQITQLKEEITSKDHSLVKEHFDHHKVEKEKEILKNELTKIRKQTESSEQIIANQEAEIQKLAQIVHDANCEQERQQKEYLAIISERDLLGAQLIKRNTELASLYEKIKIQMSSLRKGQSQFNEITAHLRKLKKATGSLREEHKNVKEQIQSIPELETEIIALERDVAQERSKIKALSDEMERPLNVHRWRKLESSDPERFALIRKIQKLQVKLIKKTEEVAVKTQQIEEKEKLYVELKNVLARKPGPEVAEQLVVYQQNLKDKQRQIKEMEAQLDKHRAKVNEYKFEISSINQEMSKLKKLFLNKKRAELRASLDREEEDDEEYDEDDASDSGSSSSSSSSSSDDEDGLEETPAPPTKIPSINQNQDDDSDNESY